MIILDSIDMHAYPSNEPEVRFCMHERLAGIAGFLGRALTKPIATIDEGAVLSLCSQQRNLFLDNVQVGRLSNTMQLQLQGLLRERWRIDYITVYAIVCRLRGDEGKGYLDRCRQDKWEVILPRIGLRRGGYG